MSANPYSPPPWWVRLLGAIVALVLVLVMLLGTALTAGVAWLNSSKEKRFDDIALLNGGSIAFRRFDLSAWDTYPHLQLYVDSLRLSAPPDDPGPREWLRVGQGCLVIEVDPFGDTLVVVDSLSLRGGGLHFVSADKPPNDVERSIRRDDSTARRHLLPYRERVVFAPGFSPDLRDFDLRYERPSRGTDVDAYVRTLRADSLRAEGGFAARLNIDATLRGLQFNPKNGPYGRDAQLVGTFRIEGDGSTTRIRADGLNIGESVIDFRARLEPKGGADSSHLVFGIDSTVLARAGQLLSPGIREAIAPYDLDGVFRSETTLWLPPRQGERALVRVELAFDDNDARATNLTFPNTYLRGRYVNRPGSDWRTDTTYGSRFEVDTVRTTLYGLRTTTRGAVIRALRGESATVDAPRVHARGPASAVAELANAQDFSFSRGRAQITAHVRGPLDDANAMVARSDGRVDMRDVAVGFAGTSVQLPLKQVRAVKQGANATVYVAGQTRRRDHTFTVEGEIEGVRALLRSGTGDSLRTRATFRSPHLSWRDALELFAAAGDTAVAKTSVGENSGGPADGLATRQLKPTRPDTAQATTVDNLKQALRQVQSTFAPSIDVAIDTLSYYGFRVHDFRTGLHFDDSTRLVLERSSLRVDRAPVRFSGRLDIRDRRRTGFAVELEAEELDLATLLPQANYFGQDFLADIGILPDDIDVHVEQRGTLDDVRGLLPNRSEGVIVFNSDGTRPFDARIEFEPDRPDDPDYNSARVWLSGSPELFNGFFQTERFIFDGGVFRFWMGYSGLVPDVRTLVDNEDMTLDVRRARVRFEDLEVFVPVERLSLDVHRDTAQLYMFLRSERLDQELRVTGVARNVSEVAFGDTGKQFSTDVKVSSPRLVWRDMNALIGEVTESGQTAAADTSGPETLRPASGGASAATVGTPDSTKAPATSLRQSVREIMRTFRPSVRLEVGELELAQRFAVQTLVSAIHMDASDHLYIDTTAFDYRAGTMTLTGDIALGDLSYSPFRLRTRTDDLNVASLLANLDYLDMASLRDARKLAGELSLDVDVRGAVEGYHSARLSPTATDGTVDLDLTGLVIDGLAEVDSLTEKFRIDERSEVLRFAPIRSQLTLDGRSIRVPMTEVTSNAFTIFAAGEVGLQDSTNLWISVPLANVTAPDEDEPVELHGFDDFTFKVHVQLRGAPGQAVGTKLRWSRRKYKQAFGE